MAEGWVMGSRAMSKEGPENTANATAAITNTGHASGQRAKDVRHMHAFAGHSAKEVSSHTVVIQFVQSKMMNW